MKSVLSIVLLTFILSPSVQAKKTSKTQLLTAQQYKSMSLNKRQDYISFLQDSYIKLEKMQRYKRSKMQYVQNSKNKWPSLLNLIAPKAWGATSERKECIIGGVIRPMVQRASDSRWLCRTFGRACNSKSDSFKCGMLFGSVCISRTPPSSISKRCKSTFDQSSPEGISVEVYNEKIKPVYDRLLSSACANSSKKVCKIMQDEVSRYSGSVVQQLPPATVTPEPPAAPAPAATSECTGLYVMNIEGNAGQDYQQDFIETLRGKSIGYMKAADHIEFIRPRVPSSAGVTGYKVNKMLKLRNKLIKSDSDEVCLLEDELAESMIGTGAFMQDNLGQNDGSGITVNKGGCEKLLYKNACSEMNFQGEGLFSKSETFIRAINHAKECDGDDDSDKNLRVVINLAAHGYDNGGASLGNGAGVSDKLTPEQLYNNLVKPLMDKGIDVTLDIQSCFSGHFKVALDKLVSNHETSKAGSLCLYTSAADTHVTMGGDPVMFNYTSERVFNKAIKIFDDQYQARLCAAVADNFNRNYSSATRSLELLLGNKRDPQYHLITNNISQIPDSSLEKQNINPKDFRVKCKTAVNQLQKKLVGSRSFSMDKMKDLYKCMQQPEKKDTPEATKSMRKYGIPWLNATVMQSVPAGQLNAQNLTSVDANACKFKLSDFKKSNGSSSSKSKSSK